MIGEERGVEMRVVAFFGVDVGACGEQRDVPISGGGFGDEGYVWALVGFVLFFR